MKKIFYAILLLLSMIRTGIVKAQTPMFYKAGATIATNTIPFNQTVYKIQFLYEPSDFNIMPSAGNITKIYFRNSAANSTGTYTDFKVSFTQTTDPSIPGTAFYTGLTQALSSASFTATGNATAGGWFEIPLATPYPYNNAQSLVVELQWTGKTGGFSTSTTTASATKRLYSTTLTATTGTTSTAYNDFGMDVVANTPCTSPPTPGTTLTTAASICTGNPFTLSLSGNSAGTGQTYQWQSAPTATGTYTNIGTASTQTTLTTTGTATAWYRVAVTCGTSTANSTPVQVTVNPGLPGGTYTINSASPTAGTNFQTFGDAVAAMSCGISGPVVFNVAPASGPYNEQIVIPSIGGASAANTITFNGNGRTIQGTPVSATRAIIQLDGADYIRLNNLVLVSQSATYGWGVHLTNGADRNTIYGCTINMTATTSTVQSNSGGIVASGSNTVVTTDGSASYNTIDSNTILGGYQGIIMNGGANAVDAVGNVITNNKIQDFYANGMELTGTDSVLVAFNDISRLTRTAVTTFAGIELGDDCKRSVINGNRIHDSHTAATTQSGTSYGIFINADDAPLGSENRIINNLIYKMNSTTGTIYGIYNSGSDGSWIFHNTIVLDHAAATAGITRGFYQTTSASNIRFENNIVQITRGGTGVKIMIYLNTAASAVTSNRNDLYLNAPAGTNSYGYANATTYATLANWQGANYDQQSVSINPAFQNAAAGNFLPTATALDDLGGPAGVATDIRNVARATNTPDMGAYEFGCLVPLNLTASAITPTSATLSWAAQGGVTSFEYVLDQLAANPAGAGTATTATTYNAGSLTPSTTYYIHVRTSCAPGFSAWVTIPFTTLCQGPASAITAAGPVTFCKGNSVVLNAPSGTYTYQWYRNGNIITGATSASYTADTTGAYTVNVINATNCGTLSAPVNVTVNPLPPANISASSSTSFCTGGSVVLSAPVAPTGSTYSYVWRNNTNPITPAQTGQTYTATTSGNITVTVTNTATSCAATTSAPVVVNAGSAPAAVITAAGSATICQGQTVRLRTNNTPGLSYQWKLGGTDIPGANDSVYNAGQAGNYTVNINITGAPTCATLSAPFAVTVNALPNASITASGAPTTFCTGGSVVLTGNTGANLTYQWQSGSAPTTPPNTTAAYTATASGNYSLIVTNTATQCFNTSNTIAVTVNPLPVATITASGATALCIGNSVMLNANTGSGLTYQWFNGTTPLATTASYTTGVAGSYTVRVTNGNNCVATSAATVVTVNPLPPTGITPTGTVNTCSGSPVVLSAPTAPTGMTYQWRNGAANASGTSTGATYSATAAGTYRVVITTAAGCRDSSAATTVAVLPLPATTMSPAAATTACDSVTLTTTNTDVTHQWNYNGAPIIGATSPTYAARVSGNYSLTNTSTINGCAATTANVALTINQSPLGHITYSSPIIFCDGGAVVLNTYAAPNQTYEWRNTNVLIPGSTSNTHTTTESGSYTVRVSNTVTGCSRISQPVIVKVHPLPAPVAIYTPAGNVLSTTRPYLQYQWYYNQQPIGGAVHSTYNPTNNGAYSVSVTDSNGCTNIAPIVFVNSLGVPNTPLGASVKVYPNPTAGKLHVDAPVRVNLALRDVTGKLVAQAKDSRELDIERFADGMYLLYISTTEGQLIRADKITKNTR